MRRHRDGELSDLVRNTIIWIVVVIWLAWSYVYQAPPADSYTDATRNVFTVILLIVIPLTSAIVLFVWVDALRDRRDR
jgi:heme/copper-type cytochrome/quinol oxidase subunit 2